MKRLLFLLLVFLLTATPAGVAFESSESPYIAVFSSASPECIIPWRGEPVNLMYIAGSWSSYKTFLKIVKERAGTRPIIIDIDCHGTKQGYLSISKYVPLLNVDVSSFCNLGYIINSNYDAGVALKEMYLEACYSGTVYNKANPLAEVDKDMFVESAAVYPAYPIWGVKNFPNKGNSTYLQKMKFKDPVCVEDLRVYEFNDPGFCRQICWNSKVLEDFLDRHHVVRRWNREWTSYKNRTSVVLSIQNVEGPLNLKRFNYEYEAVESGCGGEKGSPIPCKRHPERDL